MLEVKNIEKIYTTRFGGNQVKALSNVSFSVEDGEYVAIMGESGSGKTTLLNILAALDKPTKGEVILGGKSLRGSLSVASSASQITSFSLISPITIFITLYLSAYVFGSDILHTFKIPH